MSPATGDRDEMGANILAAGGLSALIWLGQQQAPGRVEFKVEMENGLATNRLVLRLPFLKSPYRVTVERIARMDSEAQVR